jgi:hypothetical protein
MSLMDKIKEFFSGSSAGEGEHAGHDHTARAPETETPAAPVPAADPTGMAAPSPAPGSVAMPEPAQPDEPERRDDL